MRRGTGCAIGLQCRFFNKNSAMRVSKFYLPTLKEAPAEAEVTSHRLMLRAGDDPAPRSGHLHVDAARPARAAQGRGDRARGDEPRRRDRAADAGGAARRAVAGNRTLGQVRAGAAAPQGPAPARLHRPADVRGSDHRHRAQGDQQLQAAAGQFLPDPDEIPRRDAAALRRDALARIRDEGRVLVRRRPRRDAASPTRRCTTPTRASSRGWASSSARSPPTPAQIGGSASHEFQVLADSGEDAIAWCPASDYAANVELAEALAPAAARPAAAEAMQKVPTPGQETCEEVAALLGLPLARTVKCIMLAVDAEGAPARVHMLLIRGDHALNEVKVSKIPGPREVPLGERSGNRRRDRLPARLSRPGRHSRGPAADRRPRGRGDGRLRLRRQRARISTCAASTSAATAASPTASPTCATSSPATRRPTARARWRSCAASRSATCSRSARATRRT